MGLPFKFFNNELTFQFPLANRRDVKRRGSDFFRKIQEVWVPNITRRKVLVTPGSHRGIRVRSMSFFLKNIHICCKLEISVNMAIEQG